MEQKKGRRNPIFDLSDPKQKNAFEFLGIIERDQAVCISILINKLMEDYNISDLSNITKEEIKKILKKVENENPAEQNAEINKIDIRELVLSILKENQGETEVKTKKEHKAHDEPYVEEEMVVQTKESKTEVYEEEEEWEEHNESSLNIELLAELASFST